MPLVSSNQMCPSVSAVCADASAAVSTKRTHAMTRRTIEVDIMRMQMDRLSIRSPKHVRKVRWSIGLVLAVCAIPATAQPPQSQVTSNSDPVVSPDGRHVAFISNRGGVPNVFVIDSDGANERRLTSVRSSKAQWSPDGNTVLFSGAAADSGRVFAVAITGGDVRPVASIAGRGPVLSPDGNSVVYLSGPWTSTATMVARPDGSGARRIAGGEATAWNGAWSPDSKRIAYTYGDSSRRLQVHVVGADGGGDVPVTRMSADDGSAQLPAWSADGKRLAVQVNNISAGNAHIWTIELATGKARKLAPHVEKFLDEIPSWFPDGKHLVFQSNRSGRTEVWVMDSDGTHFRQITGIGAR
jgi:TolB protein